MDGRTHTHTHTRPILDVPAPGGHLRHRWSPPVGNALSTGANKRLRHTHCTGARGDGGPRQQDRWPGPNRRHPGMKASCLTACTSIPPRGNRSCKPLDVGQHPQVACTAPRRTAQRGGAPCSMQPRPVERRRLQVVRSPASHKRGSKWHRRGSWPSLHRAKRALRCVTCKEAQPATSQLVTAAPGAGLHIHEGH